MVPAALHAILRAIPEKALGVIAMFGRSAALILPWLDGIKAAKRQIPQIYLNGCLAC